MQIQIFGQIFPQRIRCVPTTSHLIIVGIFFSVYSTLVFTLSILFLALFGFLLFLRGVKKSVTRPQLVSESFSLDKK